MIKAGPIGSTVSKTGTTNWDEKGNTMISHIFVSFDTFCVTSIQFGYVENGALVMSPKYGSSSEGHSFRVVKLNHNEYVTGLSGVIRQSWPGGYTPYAGMEALTFYTNLGKHGPICEPTQTNSNVTRTKKEINLAMSDRCEFDGFFGSCDLTRLTSIGINVNPIPSFDAKVKRENV